MTLDSSVTHVKPQQRTTVVSARRKMELSKADPAAVQREIMGTDVDIEKFILYFSGRVETNLADRVIDASISRTMDGSSILTVTINDYDRVLLSSGFLSNRLDVEVDGLWFRLAGTDKQGNELTLTFEDRAVAVLRTYDKWKVARRSKVTRAEFVMNLINEVKEFKIPVVIPELHTVQPIERFNGDINGYDYFINKNKGIALDHNKQKYNKLQVTIGNFPKTLTDVKGIPDNIQYLRDRDNKMATPEQIRNANIILSVGEQMTNKRKLKVCAIMTSMEEANLINNPGGSGTSAGLFQQIDQYWGSYADRTNPETSSRAFFNHIIANDKKYPNMGYNDLCQSVQQSGYPDRYGTYRERAEQFVTAYGIPGGDNELLASVVNGQTTNTPPSGEFYFYRGNISGDKNRRIRKPENSWDCIQRLAGEVDWRAFFVGGVFYFISEDDLLKAQPLLNLDEFAEGIIDVSGEFHNNKKSASMTIQARVGRWDVPPGGIVVVTSMGPYDGRWLVSEYSRSLFDLNATITLIRERPQLPEPRTSNSNLQTSWGATQSAISVGSAQATGQGPSPSINSTKDDLAAQLLALYKNGWNDDNGKGWQQIWDTANGHRLISSGYSIDLDPRILKLVLWLIQDQGFTIGTFAWATDHHNDGLAGHTGGHAVDISSINGVAIGGTHNQQTHDLTYKVDKILNSLQGELRPRQLINAGYGNVRDFGMQALCLPNSDLYNYPDPDSGVNVLDEHCNHIHVGY